MERNQGPKRKVIGVENDSGEVVAIGLRIKALREKRGWLPSRLAKLSGVSHTYITQIEKGTRPKLGVDIVLQIARALRVQSTDEITGYDVTALPPPEPVRVQQSASRDDRIARLEQGQVQIEAGLKQVASTLQQLLEFQANRRESEVQVLEQEPEAKAPPRATASRRKKQPRRRKSS